MSVDPRLAQAGIDNLPLILSILRALFGARHPEVVVTDAEVHAALQDAITKTLAEDARLLAESPPPDQRS